MSDLSQLLADSKGLPAAFRKTNPKGTVWAGKITKVIVRQARDDDGQPRTWEDGNPVQEVVVAIETNQRDPERKDDDGVRGIYIKWWGEQKKAFREAMENAGVEDLEVGGLFAAQYVDDGPQPRDPKLSPAKLMRYEYKPPTGVGGLLGGTPAAGNGHAQPGPVATTTDPWGGVNQGAPATDIWGQPTGPTGAQPATHAPAATTTMMPPNPPVATPVGPPAPAETDPAALLATIKAFLALGMTDEQIAAGTKAPAAAIAAIRALP